MPIPSPNDVALMSASVRAIGIAKGAPMDVMPTQSIIAAIVKHGGLYTLLDDDMMTSRIAAFTSNRAPQSPAARKAAGAGGPAILPPDMVQKLRASAANFFYKLVNKPGYTVHSELMAYISEPGKGNGVTYDEGIDPSPDIPAAFTFVGQFIDHDLTFNGMNLTADEAGATVGDNASPLIDLDSVYGPDSATTLTDDAFDRIFDKKGKFNLTKRPLAAGGKKYEDVPREPGGLAYIFDPRNDENQLILQIHLLVERLHNAIVDDPAFKSEIQILKKPAQVVDRVRKEVVAIWQSFILNDYMKKIIRPDVLKFVLGEINKRASDVDDLVQEYGELKHKPYRDLVTGKNVVRMPHEFAIGFRFGHTQLRPVYTLNATHDPVILFKDARHSDKVTIQGVKYDGLDDMRGGRPLDPEHVIDWNVFYPVKPNKHTQSLRIDRKVTSRVFNLPESAIPDDIKYIANLPHRNLIRGSQIGVVSGEELAEFYGITPLTSRQVLGKDARDESEKLFTQEPKDKPTFKTPLWYYIITEGEVSEKGARLGPVGSRLVGEVLAGAIYYGNEFPYKNDWTPLVIHPGSNVFTLHEIINYVLAAGS